MRESRSKLARRGASFVRESRGKLARGGAGRGAGAGAGAPGRRAHADAAAPRPAPPDRRSRAPREREWDAACPISTGGGSERRSRAPRTVPVTSPRTPGAPDAGEARVLWWGWRVLSIIKTILSVNRCVFVIMGGRDAPRPGRSDPRRAPARAPRAPPARAPPARARPAGALTLAPRGGGRGGGGDAAPATTSCARWRAGPAGGERAGGGACSAASHVAPAVSSESASETCARRGA